MNKKKFRNGFFCFVKLHKKVNENYENYFLLILDLIFILPLFLLFWFLLPWFRIRNPRFRKG